MKNFTLYTPTRIVFGKEVEKRNRKACKRAGSFKVLIVYGGGSIIKSGLLKSVQKSLQKEGIAYTELAGVKPNPRMSLAREGVEKAISFGADLILAVGGGSSIDTAKAIAIGAANGELIFGNSGAEKKRSRKCFRSEQSLQLRQREVR